MTEIDVETQEIINKLTNFFKTPEGQEHLKKVQAAVEEFERELRKQEEITPEVILKKVTI